ncbi:hypothetical protein HPP92_026053 [Vanilla planifolia]|uniref:Uncharacterized protein n=1 Tax=Vanilla planifolia TaxID=51239 RepID=A0A835PHU1_VANPL|nr:hypothetical protein HPP92_026327 [Vanilla planifolia]KAG0451795.1 hypothetical protein HPP92_026053 [Vanilla planifolia]
MAEKVDAEMVEAEQEVVFVELPAPAGWKKKFTPKKGGTPKRNEIVLFLQLEKRLEIRNDWISIFGLIQEALPVQNLIGVQQDES